MIPRVLAGTIVVALFVATVSEARPGGGDTYSADSRSDRGGDDGDASGEGDLEALVALVQLCLRYPKFGVPSLLLVIGFVVYTRGAVERKATGTAHERRARFPRATRLVCAATGTT